MNETTNSLKRSLTLPLISLYGLGNILGAGIYVLIGKVAGEAGYYSPAAFLVASVIAGISALSYSELSTRYPVSAGEAVYIQEGFNNSLLSRTVGLLITLAGIVSSAAITHGFAGYLQTFIDVPTPVIITLLILSLGALAAWGIDQSVKLAAILTLVELVGLLLIIATGYEFLNTGPDPITDQSLSSFSWIGVMSGAFLAFYAYIGFEDMVNIAEEVKQPEKNMPMAILICVVMSTLLYATVAWIATSILTPAQLSASDAPLADIYSHATGKTPVLITVIGLFAVVNGALIQIIMASRLIYGMAYRQWLPAKLGVINSTTRTPVYSTILVVITILIFALLLPLVTLAELTSYLVLGVFSLVNLALVRIKQKKPDGGQFTEYPAWVPKLGFLTTTSFLLIELASNIA